MKRLAVLLATALALSACTTTGGPSGGSASTEVSPEAGAFAGDWRGQTARGSALRIFVSPAGDVTYYFRNQRQTIRNVSVSPSRISFSAGANPTTLTADGAYTYVYAPTGEVTRATLRKG